MCKQLVSKHIEIWWKPVNIFETFERVQQTPFLMPPLPNWILRLRYLNDKNYPPKYRHISTQDWICGEEKCSRNYCDWFSRKRKISGNCCYWRYEAVSLIKSHQIFAFFAKLRFNTSTGQPSRPRCNSSFAGCSSVKERLGASISNRAWPPVPAMTRMTVSEDRVRHSNT